jgi:8-oxo-dGTP pyrophosphatase MutT (NUDIX family)
VPIFEADGAARLILTKRPETMPSHQGEIAFPGGKLEPNTDADLRAAALREAHEEIGIEPAAVEIVAELDHLVTVSARFALAPFVGLLAVPPVLVPHPREVAAVFDVAIDQLLAPDAKEFGTGLVGFGYPAAQICCQVRDGREFEECRIAGQFGRRVAPALLPLFLLQVEFDLVDLQFVQQLERIAGALAVARQPIEQFQRLCAGRPAAHGGRGAALEPQSFLEIIRNGSAS